MGQNDGHKMSSRRGGYRVNVGNTPDRIGSRPQDTSDRSHRHCLCSLHSLDSPHPVRARVPDGSGRPPARKGSRRTVGVVALHRRPDSRARAARSVLSRLQATVPELLVFWITGLAG